MCIILDANISHHFDPPSSDAKPIIAWLDSGAGILAIGGKNTIELTSNHKMRRWLRTLLQAGRAYITPSKKIEQAETEIKSLRECRSNDAHIIALARASGARLLYSNDRNLHVDFTNPRLLNRPRGKVYQSVTHKHLLLRSVCRG